VIVVTSGSGRERVRACRAALARECLDAAATALAATPAAPGAVAAGDASAWLAEKARVPRDAG
jgi:hypothetical protein